MRVVAEVLYILSIATKEMEQSKASESFLKDMLIARPPSRSIQKNISRYYWEEQMSRMP